MPEMRQHVLATNYPPRNAMDGVPKAEMRGRNGGELQRGTANSPYSAEHPRSAALVGCIAKFKFTKNMTNDIIPANSAVSIIQQAIASGADPAYLRELLQVREQWEAGEARKLYSQAIADFQSRCPIIEKGDKAHNKQYAAMDRIWRTIRPLLDETGLSVVWTVNALTDYGLHIEGEIRHKAGHSVAISYDLPMPEKVTGQNAAQVMGSATTYARRYGMCSALGIITGEDDDGLAAGTSYVTKEQSDELAALVRNTPQGTLEALLEWAACDSLSDLPASKYNAAKKALIAKQAKP